MNIVVVVTFHKMDLPFAGEIYLGRTGATEGQAEDS